MLEYENCELFYLLAVASNIFSRGFLSFADENNNVYDLHTFDQDVKGQKI